MTRLLAAGLLAMLLGACETAPVAPVPDPLPEALPWASSDEVEAGAFLGVEARENDAGSLDELSFDPGIRVTAVAGGSPAAAAGLRVGDVLLEFEGVPLYAPEDLEARLRERAAGDAVTFDVLRDDTVFELELALRSADGNGSSEVRELYRIDVSRTRAAWATGPTGVVLVSSAPDGPTERAGLEIGAVVVAIDGESVASDRGMIRRLATYEPGSEPDFEVRAGDSTELVSVELHEPREMTTHFVFPILWNYSAEVTGERTEFVLIDLYVISLFRYTREGNEKEWRFLRFFQTKSDVGELTE